jgi:hypothetical protein
LAAKKIGKILFANVGGREMPVNAVIIRLVMLLVIGGLGTYIFISRVYNTPWIFKRIIQGFTFLIFAIAVIVAIISRKRRNS